MACGRLRGASGLWRGRWGGREGERREDVIWRERVRRRGRAWRGEICLGEKAGGEMRGGREEREERKEQERRFSPRASPCLIGLPATRDARSFSPPHRPRPAQTPVSSPFHRRRSRRSGRASPRSSFRPLRCSPPSPGLSTAGQDGRSSEHDGHRSSAPDRMRLRHAFCHTSIKITISDPQSSPPVPPPTLPPPHPTLPLSHPHLPLSRPISYTVSGPVLLLLLLVPPTAADPFVLTLHRSRMHGFCCSSPAHPLVGIASTLSTCSPSLLSAF
ncbi:hypothetical protein BC628DRAFT_512394 [Trametes gibbosa]|nr:hypothetical protein BC628DRAFT_512394 [Trametes gibbosa]